jgi:hypothetical protein
VIHCDAVGSDIICWRVFRYKLMFRPGPVNETQDTFLYPLYRSSRVSVLKLPLSPQTTLEVYYRNLAHQTENILFLFITAISKIKERLPFRSTTNCIS